MKDLIKKFDALIVASFLLLALLDAFVWLKIGFERPLQSPRLYFLDIGQGDAELIVLPGNIKILTDAGPDKKVLAAFEKLPLGNHYIDIAIISHPQLDHFNGFQYLLDRYQIGAFIFNGRSDDPKVKEWAALLEKIKQANIPLITLAAGDRIRYQDSRIDFLSPNDDFVQSGELNDTGFVELLDSRGLKALLTADIGSNIERYLIDHFDVQADVLKVPHHGSRFSSSDEFLKAVNPKLAVIEVGAHNRYGHPTKETLARLASSTAAKVFRTDINGTVSAFSDGRTLKVFTGK